MESRLATKATSPIWRDADEQAVPYTYLATDRANRSLAIRLGIANVLYDRQVDVLYRGIVMLSRDS